MSVDVPRFATHYYRADRSPFLNLSDLDESELELTLADLNHMHADGSSSRIFGRRYMEMRRLTERRVRELFVEAGGEPQRHSPHYFVLGSSSWFRGLAVDMQEITLALADFPSLQTSVTYPDSFAAMEFGPQFGLPQEQRPYHGNVYRIEQLASLVEQFGLPTDDSDYSEYHLKPFEKYIEIQLWSDEPISEYLMTTTEHERLRRS